MDKPKKLHQKSLNMVSVFIITLICVLTQNPVVFAADTGNKWVYIALAVLFGIFGIQFFYTGETSKGIKCFLFFWTGIPYFYSLYMAVVALFKPVNEKGEITFQSKPKVMRIS